MENTNQKPVYKLTVCAILVALASVLSLITVLKMPLGGSVTLLSMLPIVMISVMYGLGWGIASSFVYSLIQLFLGITMDGVLGWGLTPLSLTGTIVLDYLLAFTVLGFAGAFRKKGYIGICLGTVMVLVLRFICHFISGVIIFDIWCEWSNVPFYSLCYNGAYMLPELVLTTIGAIILFRQPQVKRLFRAN